MSSPDSNHPAAVESTAKKHKSLIISDAQSVLIYRKLMIGRALVLSSYFGLIALFTFLNFTMESGSLKRWIVELVPLLIFAPGLLLNVRRAAHRTYSWICFVVLIYFVAIIPLVMGRGLWSDWAITILDCLLFVSAMMTSRWLQYWNHYLSTRNQPNNSHSE